MRSLSALLPIALMSSGCVFASLPSAAQNSSLSSQFDVLDVSFLFGLPREDPNELISLTDADFLSEPLVQQAVRISINQQMMRKFHIRYEFDEEGNHIMDKSVRMFARATPQNILSDEDMFRKDGNATKLGEKVLKYPESVERRKHVTKVNREFTLKKNLSSWKLVSMRFKPCFEYPQSYDKCRHTEFRLTFQPLRRSEDIISIGTRNGRHPLQDVIEGQQPPPFAFEDYSLHLTYAFDYADAPSQVDELKRIKEQLLKEGINTTGIALGVHPALEAGKTSLSRDMIENFIKRQCREKDLEDVAVAVVGGHPTSATTNQFVWSWALFKPTHENGKTTLEHLPILRGVVSNPKEGIPKSEAKYQSFVMQDIGYYPDIKPNLRARTLVDEAKHWRSDNRHGGPSKQSGFNNSSLARPEVRDVIVHKTSIIDDPRVHNIRSIDCVSCHISSITRLFTHYPKTSAKVKEGRERFYGNYFDRLLNPKKHLDPSLEKENSPRFTLGFPSHLSYRPRTVPVRTLSSPKPTEFPMVPAEYNFKMFSYFFAAPTVSQRTVNESVFDAHFINSQLLATPKQEMQ